MLTPEQRYAVPALAAQVADRFPGCTLTLDGAGAVLTVGPNTPDADRDAAITLVAAVLADFRLATPNDPEPAPIPDGWAATHRRGNHHLDTYSASAFR